MTRDAQSPTGTSRKGADPRAPHWFDFNKLNQLPNEWAFRVLDWDDDPDTDGVVDRGEGEAVRGEHRFVINTWLQPRGRTHDRYWSICYETVNQDGDPEPLSFHIGRTQSMARNNLGYARDSLDDSDAHPHVLVREHDDAPRETFEFATRFMAEGAADLQIRLKMDDPDRNYRATVHTTEDWEDQLELERSLQEVDDG